MGGSGTQLELHGPSGESLGLVWESGHFEGHGVEGRVRRTPAGWSVFVEDQPAGTIDRDGRHTAAPVHLDGVRVLDEANRELTAVDDEGLAAAALALVGALPPGVLRAIEPSTPVSTSIGGPWLVVATVVLVMVGLAALVVLVS